LDAISGESESTKRAKILNSIREDSGRNNPAKQLNHTIKHQYLSWFEPTAFNGLKRMLL
jgi:hypothetical protein